MRTYARTCLAIGTVPGVVGLFLCLTLVPVGAWTLAGTVVASAVLLVLHELQPWAANRTVALPPRAVTTTTVVVVVLATWGWARLVPVLGAIVLLALVVGALPVVAAVVSSVRREHPPRPRRGPGTISASSPAVADLGAGLSPDLERVRARLAPEIASWDDARLCRCWRTSFTRLQRAAVDVKPAIVLERQLCLDELLRRHPSGTTHWLRTGARAAGDPSRHLARQDDPVRGDES